MSQGSHYVALALQIACHTVNRYDGDECRSKIMENIERVGYHLAGAKTLAGQDTRLVVLPEYFLTGYPLGETIPTWAEKACLSPNGPEYEALGKIAQDNKVFLSGNVYETDQHFPNIYFQTCFIIDDSGDVILRYRRLISMFAPTPHDVWDKYLDIYGADAIFPVVDTELGRLACCASEEILYPEICRSLVLNGAEVILHPTSETASNNLTPKDVCKRARAVENLVYVVSANSGGVMGSPILGNSVDGMSKIIDFQGRVLASTSIGETMTCSAELDLSALRRYRRRPGMANTLSRQRLDLFRDTYQNNEIHSANGLLKNGKFFVPNRSHFVETQLDSIKKLSKKGLI